jgi:hypothetical protein
MIWSFRLFDVSTFFRGLCVLRGETILGHRRRLSATAWHYTKKKLLKRTQITPVLQEDQCRFLVAHKLRKRNMADLVGADAPTWGGATQPPHAVAALPAFPEDVCADQDSIHGNLR